MFRKINKLIKLITTLHLKRLRVRGQLVIPQDLKFEEKLKRTEIHSFLFTLLK